MNRLQEKYLKEVVPAMKEKFNYRNNMAVPKIMKVTINSGVGKFKQEQKVIDEIANDITQIAGQKAVFTQAKKAIASFKTRQGQVVGIKVTLRGKRMYDFLDRLISLALPRTRDFRGFDSKTVDSGGNLNIGLKEQIVFPEISHEQVRTIFGLEVCVTTNAKKHQEGLELFKLLGFPIK
ncbi:MAG: 50S ribosomal protein L5 [Parcubacteria group bacterium GW2011_GWA2_43_9b]|uniref:Large ribosomal subunit protein uL5 n=1 Tax=Candidatus Portnoybacteria bacterium RIFCSPLOWO2_02_FULL_39_11 TaxID=1802001 RepID=A0A1G2FN92_9BACT|nr:MAG: 50S ribosomal protein L5 [Parcubacteria group bacterium GW2011_GWA2_43_9b]OGZ39549.1 MAG: 50S ribosomal protein L5 [Candidatus Portnoybacteria bacterium RIFCSPLOWO2_02_FULL_39_11]